MLEKAMRLCEADFGILNTYDGERFHRAAARGEPSAHTEWRLRRHKISGPGTGHARIVAGEDVVHTLDLMAEAPYRDGDPDRRAFVDLAGARTGLIVALRKERSLLGTIRIFRQEVRSFTDKQIALLQNFAAQAVIAMENARLITETREALEQQTAVAEVLGVVNSSPGDLAPVFDAILEKAHTLCGAAIGALLTFDGESFGFLARKVSPEHTEITGRPFKPGPQNRLNDLIRGEPLLDILDAREVLALAPEDPQLHATIEVGGMRTFLAVPLRKDDRLIGVLRPLGRRFSRSRTSRSRCCRISPPRR
jgi:GAF domain-containing protein